MSRNEGKPGATRNRRTMPVRPKAESRNIQTRRAKWSDDSSEETEDANQLCSDGVCPKSSLKGKSAVLHPDSQSM